MPVQQVISGHGRGIAKVWTTDIEDAARSQVENIASMPFIHRHVAIMPDVHWGMGATIGSVIPTVDAIIPAAVGVDLGCGMMAVRLNLNASELPDDLSRMRSLIEIGTPHGRSDNGGRNDKGGWRAAAPTQVMDQWSELVASKEYRYLFEKYPKVFTKVNDWNHLGTLGTGNHFIEVCLDENEDVWVMLHSGSRGIGNRIGSFFIKKAKEEMKRWHINLPDTNLAYLPEGSEYFNDYVKAVHWAQDYAYRNRVVMMDRTLEAISIALGWREHKLLEITHQAVNCHHNYISREYHYRKSVWVTRKGAVSAKQGELGIIPGSMGARSYIVEGLGNHESFHSCSHGAGRTMSRAEAKKRFTRQDLVTQTSGVECRKDGDVIDEIPGAYKDIDEVMEFQSDLVRPLFTLKQVLCVKG